MTPTPVIAQPWPTASFDTGRPAGEPDPDDELPDPDDEQERLDRWNAGERTNWCEDCGQKFVHTSGCTRITCDPCQKARQRAEKLDSLWWGTKMYGPPVGAFVVVLLLLGPSAAAWLFASAWLLAVLYGYGVVVSGELGWSLAKAAWRAKRFWTYRRFWVRLAWVVAIASTTAALAAAFLWVTP